MIVSDAMEHTFTGRLMRIHAMCNYLDIIWKTNEPRLGIEYRPYTSTKYIIQPTNNHISFIMGYRLYRSSASIMNTRVDP